MTQTAGFHYTNTTASMATNAAPYPTTADTHQPLANRTNQYYTITVSIKITRPNPYMGMGGVASNSVMLHP